MIQTIEAVIDEKGSVRLMESIHLDRSHRALVTILAEQPSAESRETLVLSEASLAADWNRAEEDEAWSYLQ